MRSQIKKNLIALGVIFLVLVPNQFSLAAGNKPIGAECNNNSECLSGDCEGSNKKDSNGKKLSFCDCNDADDCTQRWGPPASGEWECVDGAFISFDLDYCVNKANHRIEPTLPEYKTDTSIFNKLSDAIFDTKALQANLLKEVTTFKPQLEIRLPGLEFSDLAKTVDEEGYLHIPWIGEFIKAVYNFGLMIVSIIAVIMIIIQGAKIVATGGAAKVEGYKKIGQIVVGLFIAWGSYAILYTINPALVQFNSLKVKYIVPKDLDVVEKGFDSNDASFPTSSVQAICVQPSDLASIKDRINLVGGATAYPYIHKDVLDPLLKANEIAKQRGKEITVISATRSMERQQALWDTALKKYGNETEARKFVSMPSCRSPHLTGRAVDLCLKNSPTCEKISGAFADLKDPDVQLLQDIMRQAGWKRYCKEWWHFEYGLDLPSRCSP